MNPIENFRKSFISVLPETPPELNLQLDEFVVFDRRSLPGYLDSNAISLLVLQGLPKYAAPFLSFDAYSKSDVDDLRKISAIEDDYFPIGSNGSGDILAIEGATGNIVYFNHDAHNLRIFINSNLSKFAESLYLYQKCLTLGTVSHCESLIKEIDPPAVAEHAMWREEIANHLACEA